MKSSSAARSSAATSFADFLLAVADFDPVFVPLVSDALASAAGADGSGVLFLSGAPGVVFAAVAAADGGGGGGGNDADAAAAPASVSIFLEVGVGGAGAVLLPFFSGAAATALVAADAAAG